MHFKMLFVVASSSATALAIWMSGCSPALKASDNGAGDGGALAAACPSCVTDKDCSGGVCAQIGGDTFCTPTCPMGNECASDRACTSVTTVSGQQSSACVPRGDVCGPSSLDDAGAPPSMTCGTLVGPDTKASCACSSGKTCSANGCYGGWWCDTATNRCHSPPTNCGGAPGGGVPFDGGPPVTSQINGSGGSMSRLLFGIVGDSRPASIDDTGAYPTAIVTKIYSDMDALASKPPLVVATGDYMFASTGGTQSGTQLDLYLGARGNYSGVLFPTMGNHECTGATASNCGTATADGVTSNFTSYLTKMLGPPLSKPDPYYSVNVALDGGLTAKFVFVAANAWSAAQQTWLETTLAQTTTYTFIVRHESKSANTAPGVTPSEAIMAAHPYTLSIVGHTHTYSHYAGKEVIVGNGGAPITGGKNYGFGMANQRPDGAIQVDMVDYQSGLADGSFRFAVNADGTPAP
jgi:hypothetical protein